MTIQQNFSPSFSNFTVFNFIQEAFSLIGIPNEKIEYQKIQSAIQSFNFLLMDWTNKNINLWTIKEDFFPLVWKEHSYFLPASVLNVIQVQVGPSILTKSYALGKSNYPRNVGEIASCSDPDIQSLFDLNAEAAFNFTSDDQCELTHKTDAYISYDFGQDAQGNLVYKTVNRVHLTMGKLEDDEFLIRTHRLIFTVEDSLLGTIQIFDTGVRTFNVGERVTFEIPLPVLGSNFTITQTNEDELDYLVIRSIILENKVAFTPLSKVSRYTYHLMPKQVNTRPSLFYCDKQIQPVLNVYPSPGNDSYLLKYSYQKKPDDITSINSPLSIPSQFYNAAVWGLAEMLSIKFNPEKSQMASEKYNEYLSSASFRDKENADFTFSFDTSSYRY